MEFTFHNSCYSRACAHYSDFLDITKLLMQKLHKQGWPLRNIHIFKWQWTFSFLRRFILFSVSDKTFTRLDYMRCTVDVLCYLSPAHGFTPGFMAHLFIVCFGFSLSVFALYLVCPMFPVPLDCPSLIVPSVFSNVYIIGLFFNS